MAHGNCSPAFSGAPKGGCAINTPAISVIIPVYNAEKYLLRCLDSIAGQTFGDFEALCVDDGSTDASADILDAYARKDSRFKILHQPNGGPGSARNLGLEHAAGEWLAFADADDVLHPKMYEILAGAAEEKGAHCVYCLYKEFDADGEALFDEPDPQTAPLLKECPEGILALEIPEVVLWNKLIRRSAAKDLRFPPQLKYSEDYYFTVMLYTRIHQVAFIDAALYGYAQSAGSLMRSEKRLKIMTDALTSMDMMYEGTKGYGLERLHARIADEMMHYILSFRFQTENTENEKAITQKAKDIFRRYITPYLADKNIPLKTKIQVTGCYLVPPVYARYRKALDPTL